MTKKKKVYYDRHKRSDMIAYRNKQLNKMFEYKKYIKDFDDDKLDIILES